MLVKVLIRRTFKPGNGPQVRALLNQLRAGAMSRPGYISGVTFQGLENDETMLVIGTWQTAADWVKWRESTTRRNLEAMLEIYQTNPTRYEEYVMASTLPE